MSQTAGKPVRIHITKPGALCPATWKKNPIPGVCYHLEEPVSKRRAALVPAIARAGGLKTFHRLDALVTFFKHKPAYRRIAMADRDWVERICKAHCGDLKKCGAGKCRV